MAIINLQGILDKEAALNKEKEAKYQIELKRIQKCIQILHDYYVNLIDICDTLRECEKRGISVDASINGCSIFCYNHNGCGMIKLRTLDSKTITFNLKTHQFIYQSPHAFGSNETVMFDSSKPVTPEQISILKAYTVQISCLNSSWDYIDLIKAFEKIAANLSKYTSEMIERFKQL